MLLLLINLYDSLFEIQDWQVFNEHVILLKLYWYVVNLFEYLYLATTNTPIIHDGGESIELLATFLKNLGNDGIFILN